MRWAGFLKYNFLTSVFYFEDSHSHSLKEVGKEMAYKWLLKCSFLSMYKDLNCAGHDISCDTPWKRKFKDFKEAG